ncbi:MAG: Ig-like domain-containing protein, partial [Candidatus Korarchaeota archaeon]
TYGGSPENFTIYLNGNIIAVVTPPTTNYTLTNLPEGTHNVTIVAKDLAGNTARDYVIFHIDTTPPTVHIDAPLDGAYVRGTVTIQVTWNDANPDRCELYIDGTLKYTWTTAGTVTYDWDTTQVADGPHTIEARAYDKAGNTASHSIIVIVDNTLPYVHIDTPLDGTYVRGIVTIQITWNDANPDKCELYIDGTLKYTWTTTGTVTYDWDTTQVTDGSHTIEARAYDKAGNTASHSITVIVDNTLPTVHIDAPTDGAYVHGVVTIQVTWNDANPDRCELYIDETIKYTWTTTGTVTYNWDTTQVTDGSHTIEAKAYDKAGNTASHSITVIVDNTLPYVHIDAPLDGAYIRGITTIQVTWNDANPDRCELYIDGVLKYTWTTAGTVTYNWDTTQVTDGSHTIEARAYDKVGNAASHSITVIVDNTLPTIVITSPSNGSVVSTTFYVYWNASDNIVVDRVEVYLNGSLQATYYYNEAEVSGSHKFAELSTNAWYNVTVVVYDKAGNSNWDYILVYTMPLSVTIVAPSQDQFFNTTTVVVEWTYGGSPENFTIYLNGNIIAVVTPPTTNYTLTNLPEG